MSEWEWVGEWVSVGERVSGRGVWEQRRENEREEGVNTRTLPSHADLVSENVAFFVFFAFSFLCLSVFFFFFLRGSFFCVGSERISRGIFRWISGSCCLFAA